MTWGDPSEKTTRRKLPWWAELAVFVPVFLLCFVIAVVLDVRMTVVIWVTLPPSVLAMKFASRLFGKEQIDESLEQKMQRLSAARHAAKRD